jgi:hypothetical protein
MKTLIKIAFIAIILVLGYNYFYGDDKEQEQAEKIVEKVKDLGSDIKALVMSEKEKYDEGKYDNAIDKFSDLINSVKEKISSIDFENLEKKQEELKESIKKLSDKTGEAEGKKEEQIEKEMQKLYDEIKKAVEEI